MPKPEVITIHNFSHPLPCRIHYIWTEKSIKTLIDCWNMGLSATQAGKKLGTGKNAVLGKIFRLRRNVHWGRQFTRPADLSYAHGRKRHGFQNQAGRI